MNKNICEGQVIAENSGIYAPVPKAIYYGKELKDLQIAQSREFLMVQGTAYSSSSFAGNTRRYHGLLIIDEHVFLSALHEEVNGISILPGFFGDASPDTSHIHAASLYPVQIRYEFANCSVTKTISFDESLCIRYDIIGTAHLCIRPLLTYRDIRMLGYTSLDIRYGDEGGKNAFDAAFSLHGCEFSSDLSFTRDETVYYHAYYLREHERGYEAAEDLMCPGSFHGTITNGAVTISCCHPALEKKNLTFFKIAKNASSYDSHSEDLLSRAAQLCCQTSHIYAGYHWFLESWGRDTFISLPGLLLECGRISQAEEIFSWHISHAQSGLVQNRFPDSYNSSDATLWLFWALSKYYERWPVHAAEYIKKHSSELSDLISHYPTTPITRLENNLIHVALSTGWMDTKFTGREGKPVEINSLWLHALSFCEQHHIPVPVPAADVKTAFMAFWNEEEGFLYDTLDPISSALRPNQLIPLGLGQLSSECAHRALFRICAELMTPYGPRTLGKYELGYYPAFEGDRSYHNGMVWPWLIGFFIDAVITYEFCDPAPYLAPLYQYLLTDGAGMLPEIFNGSAPYQAGGTICQAWSIGEFIRARNKVLAKKGFV
ncbi:MAG: amylo-alpha-1,6-glucosidase [Methanomicrobiales archaeon]|nr:amylo-alpha-1,6-glucosidase [Methanomicrobiales archaeon]